MNTDRLLTALSVIEEDYINLGIKKAFASLKAAAEQAAANPTDASAQGTFSNSVDDLKALLKSASANTASVSVRTALSKSGLDQLVGELALSRLNGILSRQPFMIQNASNAIAALVKEFDSLYSSAASTATNLRKLGFKQSELGADQFELGLLFPTPVLNHDLISTLKYLDGIQTLVQTVHEIIHGSAASEITIKSASSGTFELYLAMDPEDAKAIATLIMKVVGGFIAVKGLSKQRKNAEDLSYPQGIIDEMKKHEEAMVERTIEETSETIIEMKCDNIESGRVHELRTRIKRDVRFISKSINEGVDLEISPPALPDEIESEDVDPVIQEHRECIIEVKRLTDRINALTLELGQRDEPIAELPSPLDGSDASEGAKEE